jgi:hypothetical protein
VRSRRNRRIKFLTALKEVKCDKQALFGVKGQWGGETIKKNYISLKVKATSIMILLISVFLLAALSGTQLIEEVAAVDYAE